MDNVKTKIKYLANKWNNDAILIRRHLHSNPELSYMEYNTSRYISDKLNSWGISNKIIAKTGVLAIIKGYNSSKRVVSLRSDHDALPIDEKNDIPYKSTIKGVSHMCGHDAHTACNLISARILNEIKDEFEGTVKILFQPGEEFVLDDGTSGAGMMIEAGALTNPSPLSIIAQHVNPDISAGKIAISAGKIMAAVDTIFIKIIGKGGHAAQPNNCIDPIVISSHIILALQQIVSRISNPFHPTVLSIGKIAGGEMFNVIPNEVEILGTLRSYDENWRVQIYEHIDKISTAIAYAFGATVECKIKKGAPSLKNNKETTERITNYAIEYLGEDNVLPIEPYMTGEDFAFYAKEIPACFYWLGVRNETKGITSGLHTDTMNIDEEVLQIGSGLFAYLAYSELNSKDKQM